MKVTRIFVFASGLGIGYLAGAAAGRERYERISGTAAGIASDLGLTGVSERLKTRTGDVARAAADVATAATTDAVDSTADRLEQGLAAAGDRFEQFIHVEREQLEREQLIEDEENMDAIVMLRADHKQVEALFKKLEKGNLSVVPDICSELTVHTKIEEQIFYPAIRQEVESADDDIGEAFEEHHVAKVLIAELSDLEPGDERYQAKATVLMELVRHHIREEEDELFPEVREALGRNRLKELGEQMEAMKSSVASAA